MVNSWKSPMLAFDGVQDKLLYQKKQMEKFVLQETYLQLRENFSQVKTLKSNKSRTIYALQSKSKGLRTRETMCVSVWD
jgi:hypothetical protein